MNILVVGKFYTEGFALHIAETLSRMGHEVVRFEPGEASGRLPGRVGHRIDQVLGLAHRVTDGVPTIRRRRAQKLWQAVSGASLDVAIVCHDFLWPEEVAELKRRTGAAVAMWFPDHLANFGRGFFMNAPYDGLFFKDPYIVATLGPVLRSPVHYLPECFNPDRHRLPDSYEDGDPTYACEITTAGNQHSYRVAVLKHLVDWDVKLWGFPAPVWLDAGPVRDMFQGRPVHDAEKARAFRGAKIVLNNLHYGEIWGVNVRAFEVAGVGAFQLIDDRPGLGQLFSIGEEIVVYRDIDGLKRAVAEWLPRDAERREIAEAGERRAHAEHTYRHRLNTLFDTLAGKAGSFPLPNIDQAKRGSE